MLGFLSSASSQQPSFVSDNSCDPKVVTVSTLAALSNSTWKNILDPTQTQTEWEACDRPLGAWAVLWVVRVVLASGLAYWDYVRIKTAYVH
jgi:hypothetical protein